MTEDDEVEQTEEKEFKEKNASRAKAFYTLN